MYPMMATRPDLAYVVGKLIQNNAKPAKRHWQVAVRTMRCLAMTERLGITYRGLTQDNEKDDKRKDLDPDLDQDLNSQLVGYSDSDFAGDPDNRKSTSGNTFALVLLVTTLAKPKSLMTALKNGFLSTRKFSGLRSWCSTPCMEVTERSTTCPSRSTTEDCDRFPRFSTSIVLTRRLIILILDADDAINLFRAPM